MSVCINTGPKVDIFLTMTANPNWEEIQRELLPNQTASDRPDIVVRVFFMKMKDLFDLLFHKHVLGKVASYIWSVEFQKRGLPHVHVLIIFEKQHKLSCPEDFDRIICAELPNPKKDPELFEIVSKMMIHRPCTNSLVQKNFHILYLI